MGDSAMKLVPENLNHNFLRDIRAIIATARANAVRSVEFHRVEMYWKLGERIFVEEQQEKDRAEYGSYLVQNLAINLEDEFGTGFSTRQLELARQFYRTYPIANTLRSQFNWFQYRLLMRIGDELKREFYELEEWVTEFETIEERAGTMPEDLPTPVEDLKKLEKRSKAQKKLGGNHA
jgi:hypothetical protein